MSGDGYAEHRETDMGDYVMFGLSHGDTDGSYADIDYALYTRPSTGMLMGSYPKASRRSRTPVSVALSN